MEQRYFLLRNGVKIPAIGYGTGIAKGISKHPAAIAKRFVKETAKNILIPGFKEQNKYPLWMDLRKDRMLKRVSKAALEEGYRLFDTARAYQYSESYIGENLFGGGSSREDIFVITKATNEAQRNRAVREELEISLQQLGTDYVDLYLLHWPQTGTYPEAWKVMEEIYADGKAKAIGMCNCHIHHLEELEKTAEIVPMVNELECHPLLQQHKVRNYCQEKGIQIIAHTPAGKMNVKIRESEKMKRIAQTHGVSVSQAVLRWHYQLGDVSIPNTVNLRHMKENIAIWNFVLSDLEMAEIASLDCGERIWPNPDTADFMKL